MADDAINNKKNALIVQLSQQQESPTGLQSAQHPELDESNSQDLIIISGISSSADENTEITKLRRNKLNLNEIELELDEEEQENCSTQEPQNNVDIHLETPQAETAGNSGKPKRLSDEFFSADDGDEEELDEDEDLEDLKLELNKQMASCSTNSSKTNSDIRINEFDDDGNISEPAYISEETSSCSSLCYQNSQKNYFVQSYDELNAIEREDFEEEQKLTGQLILKNSNLIRNSTSSSSSSSSNHRLNLGILNKLNLNKRSGSEINQELNENDEILEKHTEELEDEDLEDDSNNDLDANDRRTERDEPSQSSTSREQKLTTTPTSSRSCNNKLKSTIKLNLEKYVNLKQSENEEDLVNFTGESSKSLAGGSLFKKLGDASTASASSSAAPTSGEVHVIHHTSEPDYSVNCDKEVEKINEEHQQKKKQKLFDEPSTSKYHRPCKSAEPAVWKTSEEPSNAMVVDHLELVEPQILETENDEDAWADCEEGSDIEEICTCREYTDEDIGASSEDELPSRDVDLSSYTHIESMSDDLFQDGNQETGSTPKIPIQKRKRKLTGCSTNESPVCLSGNRKRLALDNISTTPRSSSLLSPSLNQTPKSASSIISDKRTPRLIPTKENPPPELMEWLLQFQRWTNAERLLAVDRLIEQCEPTQVRHMMKVIEPQFQRDFISLLPKELALQVLSYLDPKDLLRAAQTCRSWRFLADDNLLWKDKCKKTGIITESSVDKPKRGRTGTMPPIASPWKAAYMRQHTIEMNWRTNPIRNPKILKGHDDHVITCLQFCGNRIVSGSDDNTLKVWSAVTGKCLRTLIGHTGGVWSSQMSGNIIISGSTDRTLKVWNAESGSCLHTLYGHTSTVRCMHLHGNKVVSGSRDATLRVWDIQAGSCLHILVGHLAAVRCVQYDGKLVVSGAYDYMVKVWNPERQECLHTLQGHTNRVYSLQFDGVHVVSGSLDTSIRVWDAESGSLKHTLMGHQSLTSGMELKSNILVSGNADSTVKVWDVLTGQCLQTLSGQNRHQSAVTCLQFNNRFVITSSDDGTVKLWDVKTGEFIRNLVALDSGGSGGVVWRIRANDTKLICAVGSRNGTEETKLMVLDFDVEGACSKCSHS